MAETNEAKRNIGTLRTENSTPYSISLVSPDNNAKATFLRHREFEMRLALQRLNSAGVVDAVSRLQEKFDQEYPNGQSFVELGYEIEPYIALYFDRQTFTPQGLSHTEFGKSRGVKAILRPKKRIEVQMLASKTRSDDEVTQPRISQSGWVAVAGEEPDLYDLLYEASKLSTPYHDLRKETGEGLLSGHPEKKDEAVEMLINRINRSIILR